MGGDQGSNSYLILSSGSFSFLVSCGTKASALLNNYNSTSDFKGQGWHYCYPFIMIYKSHNMSQMNNEFTAFTSIVCLTKAYYASVVKSIIASKNY